ncbi:MAG: hypothetical protein VR65_10645 [Desulfobulbaceae bacterium BRH_c16a]|nr:MAG: hypothetical protein VR65_10645 [Desulfobulbaceae bacterium BRH_c16a]
MNYETRVVCFIDILGFQSILDKTISINGSDIVANINLLSEALSSMEENLNSVCKSDSTTTRITQFSDSVVISFLCDEKDGIWNVLLAIQRMIIELAYREILCRGGITLGKMIHTEKLLFGPALVDAYILESKAANYPRIILGDSVLALSEMYYDESSFSKIISLYPALPKKALSNLSRSEAETFLDQDSDGMYFIDYFTHDKMRLKRFEFSYLTT